MPGAQPNQGCLPVAADVQPSPSAMDRTTHGHAGERVAQKIAHGAPNLERASTSHVERANLTVRMHICRFTRLCNAFSKKIENHRSAISLHVAWDNSCWVHESLRVTPAMEAGITDHGGAWTSLSSARSPRSRARPRSRGSSRPRPPRQARSRARQGSCGTGGDGFGLCRAGRASRARPPRRLRRPPRPWREQGRGLACNVERGIGSSVVI